MLLEWIRLYNGNPRCVCAVEKMFEIYTIYLGLFSEEFNRFKLFLEDCDHKFLDHTFQK